MPASLNAERSDALLVARMRLVLALAVLLALWVEPLGLPGMDPQRWPLFVAYGLYSLAVDAAVQRHWRHGGAPWLHWVDLLWYALMVALTGGVASMAFLFFLLPMLTASFRWGHTEGRRVVLASALAFVLASLAHGGPDAARLVLRSSFLLGLGYLCVHWGQAQVQLKRRLALLREVSQLSNPRFGVDQTLAHVLERTRDFFGATQCLLVLRGAPGQPSRMHSATPQGPASAQSLTGPLEETLLGFAQRGLVLHQHRPRSWPARPLTHCLAVEGGFAHWRPAQAAQQQLAREVADGLELGSFISVPVAMRQGRGCLYLGGAACALGRDDALFLSQLVAQAFPVIDHIDLLDRMASDAAARERQRFALDLHDTAVQPYIGLHMALAALRHKAQPDNPLRGELDKLQAMAASTIDDLRRYARQMRQDQPGESTLLAELRRQAAQVRDFYGVDIAIEVEAGLPVHDRLAAEVLQMVREGMANICKHTLAQRGEVRLQCRGGWLGICISNESSGPPQAAPFTPRSISERVAALGGRTHVQHGPQGLTAVHVHIPV